MNAVTRRCYHFGPFALDPAEQRLLRDGRIVPLTPKVFGILSLLVENSGRLVEKETFLKKVWPDTCVEEANLNRSIAILRKTLGDVSVAPRYIETVPKRGYRFIADVTEIETSRPPASSGRRVTRASAIAAGAAAIALIAFVVARPRNGSDATPVIRAHRQITFTGRETAPTISRDGRFLAYATRGQATQQITVLDLSGGQAMAIFEAPEAQPLRWSPDGRELLFVARDRRAAALYTIARTGGTPRKVMDGQYVACWSPDGRTIAVGGYLGGRMWFVDRSSGRFRSVALRGDRRSIWDLDWSPDNGRLLVASDDSEGRFALSTIAGDGSDERPLLEHEAETHSARWAAGGAALYYARRTDQTVSIFRLPVGAGRPDPSAAVPVAEAVETDARFAISDDGRRLIYTRAPYYSNLWVVEPGGETPPRELTHGTAVVERPAISPDGKLVAFTVGHESAANVHTIPIAGGAQKPLTSRAALNVGPAWSRDGRHVAFASTEGGTPRVWLADVGGSPLRPVSSGDMSESLDVVSGPGAQVFYQRRGNRDYYVLDPDTRRERLLLAGNALGWTFTPAVSPDGRRIALAWNRPPESGIWVMSPDGTGQRLVHRSDSLPALAGWSADGTAVFAVFGERPRPRSVLSRTGESTAKTTIVRVPADGGAATTVAALPFDDVGGVSVSPDGRFIVCAVYSSRSDVWMIER